MGLKVTDNKIREDKNVGDKESWTVIYPILLIVVGYAVTHIVLSTL